MPTAELIRAMREGDARRLPERGRPPRRTSNEDGCASDDKSNCQPARLNTPAWETAPPSRRPPQWPSPPVDIQPPSMAQIDESIVVPPDGSSQRVFRRIGLPRASQIQLAAVESHRRRVRTRERQPARAQVDVANLTMRI